MEDKLTKEYVAEIEALLKSELSVEEIIEKLVSDVNKDSVVNSDDITYLQEYLARMNHDENIGKQKICEANKTLNGDFCEYEDIKQPIKESTNTQEEEKSEHKEAQQNNLNQQSIVTPTANTYVINYDANGGTGTMAPQSIQFGVSTKLSRNQFVKEGSAFKGWKAHNDTRDLWNCYIDDKKERLGR